MKTKKILILSVIALALFSCAKEQLNDGVVDSGLETTNSSEIKLCMDLDTSDYEGTGTRSGKALDKYRLWDNGQTITVTFLSGSDFLQDKVMEYAKQWELYANIKFQKVSSDDANIIVAFDYEDGSSWSYIGTNSKYYRTNGATMNFGWLDEDDDEDEFSRVILHEFGHALGAIHEHQSPDADIQWNKPVVYEYYAEQGWDEARVDFNLFRTYDSSQTINSEYDPDSIMHYFLPASFTLDGFSVGENTELSITDKNFIGEAYPFDDDSTEKEEEEEEEEIADNGNLAYGKEVSQSSIHKDLPGEAERAVDGDTSGRWSLESVTRTATEYRPWWQVKLGKEYAIGDIKIWNRTDDCCAYKLDNFDVFVYDDDGNLKFKTTVNEIPSPYIIVNAGGVKGSRIRVKLKDENQLSLAEVEIFEY